MHQPGGFPIVSTWALGHLLALELCRALSGHSTRLLDDGVKALRVQSPPFS